jgi:hypothetical protein
MRRALAFLRRHLPMMLAVLALMAVVVVLWLFSTLIAQRDPPGRGDPRGAPLGGQILGALA